MNQYPFKCTECGVEFDNIGDNGRRMPEYCHVCFCTDTIIHQQDTRLDPISAGAVVTSDQQTLKDS